MGNSDNTQLLSDDSQGEFLPANVDITSSFSLPVSTKETQTDLCSSRYVFVYLTILTL